MYFRWDLPKWTKLKYIPAYQNFMGPGMIQVSVSTILDHGKEGLIVITKHALGGGRGKVQF